MKIKNINKEISKADGISRGIDHLKLNLQEKIVFLSDILSKIDDDNSNVEIRKVKEHFFSITKTRTRNGSALNIAISIDDVSHTIWQYLEYSNKNRKRIKSRGSLVYYGTYFRFIEMGILDSSFEEQFFGKELFNINKATISRVDYKLDFFYKTSSEIIKMEDIVDYRSDYKGCEYFLDREDYESHQNLILKRLNENKAIDYNIKSSFRKGDFQNGWTLGNKKNKSVFIRCYEKLIDTLGKGKVMLYDDYFLYPNVFRLEIEFLTKFNKNPQGLPFTYGEIPKLEYKILKFIGLVDNVDNEKFLYQYKENKKTDFSELRVQKDFGGRGYSLYKQGFNPFIVLYKVLRKKILNNIVFNKIILTFSDFLYERKINEYEEIFYENDK